MEPELKKRVQTGVLGGTFLLLLIIFGGRLGVAFLAAGLSIGMLFEFVEITFSLSDKREKRGVLMGTAWLIAFLNFWLPRAEFDLFLWSFFGLFAYFLFTADRHEQEALRTHFQELMYSVFGLLYLAVLPLFLLPLREGSNGVHWTLLFFFIVWAGDSGAYFAGRKYGRTPLYRHISPKKTREGALGGMVAGFCVTLLYKVLLFRSLPWFGVIFIPALIGAVAPVGDLAESFLKRAFDKKDSGSILPGHGGFLDRFDGVVFSLPIMVACSRLFS